MMIMSTYNEVTSMRENEDTLKMPPSLFFSV